MIARFVDTHCHLLPALDDGPRSLAAAVRMARVLVAGGVVTVVCTPHFSTRHPVPVPAAEASFRGLREALTSLEIPLHLELAAEVGPGPAVLAPDHELVLRRLGGRSLLVELERSTSREDVDAILARLRVLKLTPVLAHPERCLVVQESIELVDAWKSRGALLQVVAPSLTGGNDAATARAAWGLVVSGRADLLGSDGHRADTKRLGLAALADVIAGRCGEDRVSELLVDGPARLLQTAAARG